ncbi:MAG: MopE-related protein, partial [Phycisphaerales bacterium]
VASADDCDDANDDAYPGALENRADAGTDNDCDGDATSDAEAVDSTNYYVDGDSDGAGAGTATKSCTTVQGSVTNTDDCDDANPAITLPLTYYVDGDTDGYGSTTSGSFCQTSAPAGYSANDDDCNDSNASINPGSAEVCNNIDDDCDGSADDGLTFVNYYVDGDLDGYGAGAATSACAPISGSVTSNTDCDDANASVNPGRSEVCNLIDDNCSGTIDEGVQTAFYLDADNDGAGDPANMQLACSAPSGYVTNSNDQCPANGALVNAVTYYADVDGDGAGDSASSISSCSATPPSGYVAVSGDGCPSDPNKLSPGACGCGVADADSDSDGVADCNDGCPSDPNKTSPGTCGCGVPDTDTDGDGVANCNDGCPNDPNKIAPGACGCGFSDADANGNGTPDCDDEAPTATMTADASSYTPGETIVVTVSRSASNVPTAGLQLAIDYDESRLLFVSAQPSEGSAFGSEISESHDAVAGTLLLAFGIAPDQTESATAGALVDMSFVVLPGPSDCAATGLISFATVNGFQTRFTTDEGVPVDPILTALAAVSIDGDAPTLVGVPSDATYAADAGTLAGGTVLPSTVTVSDNCTGSSSVSVMVTYPNSVTLPGWPVGNLFPIGTSTVHWHASDAAGNPVNESRTVTIASHQLADVSVLLDGSFA